MSDLYRLVRRLFARRQQIVDIWQTDDVLEVRPDLTHDQAWEVLQYVEDTYDANDGICWLTLNAAADWLFPEADTPITSLTSTKGLDA